MSDDDVTGALDVARALIKAGVPIFLARPATEAGEWVPDGGHAGCGYWLPDAWEQTEPDETVVDNYRPGDALCMVQTLTNGLDSDVQSGGFESRQHLVNAGMWPNVLGLASTPSGGTHELIAPLGVGSRDHLMPGLDVKGSKPGGRSHGMLFIAPTVKLSKVTGEVAPYRWIVEPMLDELDPADDSGAAIAELIRETQRGGDDRPEAQAYDGPSFTEMPNEAQTEIRRWVAAAVAGVQSDLIATAEWPPRHTDDKKRGWEHFQADAAYRLGRLARASWNDLTMTTAKAAFTRSAPTDGGWTADDVAAKFEVQSKRGVPASFPTSIKAGNDFLASLNLVPKSQAARVSTVVRSTKEHEVTKEGFKAHPLPLRGKAMFHGLLGDLVAAADPHTEADKVGVLVSLLGGVGAILGPGPHVMIGSTRHPLLIWPLLFGHTSSGRKGEASNVANAFLSAARPSDFASIRATGLSSGEGLIERIKDPVEAEVITNKDGSTRQRRDENPGTEDKRLLVTEPEFASVMARCKRESNSLPGVMREAWEGRDLGVLTKAQTRATGSHITIAGHITPKEFRLRMAAAEMAGGTYNRFLPVYVERSKLLPLPTRLDNTEMDRRARQLRAATVKAQRIGEITMGAEASNYWTERLYQELAVADEDHAWSEFAQRAAPYARRISALYAALDGRSVVSLPDLEAAAALVTYSIDSAKYVLDNSFRDPRVDKIQRAIDESPEACVTRSQVSALFGRNLKAEQLDELLDVLLLDGAFEMVGVETAGRTAQTYMRSEPLSSPSFSFVKETAA